MDERRKFPRRRVRHPAWIGAAPNKMIDCVVLDISEGGAKIELTEKADVPETFTLLLSRLGTPKRKCRVVWSAETQIGVEFKAPSGNAGANVFAI